jgi:hypothetical protein
MGKTEKPKSTWRERKQDIKRKWLSPFIYLEWRCERLSYLLERWAFLEILGHAGRFVILLAVISYIWGIEERRKVKHYQAWQVINAAQGKPGSGGRIDALQDLNKDKVPLSGVDASGSYLVEIDLKEAYLSDANFSGANLSYANLSGAILPGADLSGADLIFTNLSGTYLCEADLSKALLLRANLSGAYLGEANLLNVRHWRGIKSIEFANIYDVNNPPSGFIEWAKEHGAKIIESEDEWEALLKEKRAKIK